MNRRELLKASGFGLSVAALPIQFNSVWAKDGFLEITAGRSSHKLYEETASDLWTYNRSLPGPEIRAGRGERIRVRFSNELEEPSSIHWHGIRIDNAMDGVSGLTQNPVQSGETFEYDFVVPDAGTYWYHAHNKSWNQVARGLYGPLIVEEDEPVFDREHDLTLILDDWRLDRDGKFDERSLGAMMDWSHAGRLGNWLTVNGKSRSTFKLKANEAYRVRLINSSNARTLVIDPNQIGAKVLAFDGQPLPEPIEYPNSKLRIGSAQRVDLLLVSQMQGTITLEDISTREPFAFADFEVSNGSDSATPREIRLPSNNLREPDLSSAITIPLLMSGGAMGDFSGILYNGKPLDRATFRETKQFWAFNKTANLTKKPFFSLPQGETIILDARNETAWEHAIHLHGHHFRIIMVDGKPYDHEGVWRDTFLTQRGQSVKIAFVAENPGKWLIHCHMLEHAAAGMNTWFEVI